MRELDKYEIDPDLFFSVLAAGAEQHPACSKPAIDQSGYSAEKLQAIAETCELPAIARLFYKCSQLRELIQEYASFTAMISTDRSGQAYIEVYRMLMGLAEVFAAEALSRGDAATIAGLNRTYDHYIEITELRLRGYDLLANYLERELLL